MGIVLKVNLNLSPEEFLAAQGESLRRQGMAEAARKALERAAALVEPKLIYDWFPVEAVEGSKVRVQGVVFHLGKHAQLLVGAALAFLAVVTIGPRLEKTAGELQASGRMLEGFLLGEAGVFAVGKLVEEAHHVAEQEAAKRGWGVGPELAPGQLAGWPIAEQKMICQLLGVEAIGVTLTETGMLVPQKSASMMIGLGPHYGETEVHSPCDFCDMRETCRLRH